MCLAASLVAQERKPGHLGSCSGGTISSGVFGDNFLPLSDLHPPVNATMASWA